MDTWKLRTIQINAEITEDYITLKDAYEKGFKILYETEEIMLMLNPYYDTVEPFIIDKTEDDSMD